MKQEEEVRNPSQEYSKDVVQGSTKSPANGFDEHKVEHESSSTSFLSSSTDDLQQDHQLEMGLSQSSSSSSLASSTPSCRRRRSSNKAVNEQIIGNSLLDITETPKSPTISDFDNDTISLSNCSANHSTSINSCRMNTTSTGDNNNANRLVNSTFEPDDDSNKNHNQDEENVVLMNDDYQSRGLTPIPFDDVFVDDDIRHDMMILVQDHFGHDYENQTINVPNTKTTSVTHYSLSNNKVIDHDYQDHHGTMAQPYNYLLIPSNNHRSTSHYHYHDAKWCRTPTAPGLEYYYPHPYGLYYQYPYYYSHYYQYQQSSPHKMYDDNLSTITTDRLQRSNDDNNKSMSNRHKLVPNHPHSNKRVTSVPRMLGTACSTKRQLLKTNTSSFRSSTASNKDVSAKISTTIHSIDKMECCIPMRTTNFITDDAVTTNNHENGRLYQAYRDNNDEETRVGNDDKTCYKENGHGNDFYYPSNPRYIIRSSCYAFEHFKYRFFSPSWMSSSTYQNSNKLHDDCPVVHVSNHNCHFRHYKTNNNKVTTGKHTTADSRGYNDGDGIQHRLMDNKRKPNENDIQIAIRRVDCAVRFFGGTPQQPTRDLKQQQQQQEQLAYHGGCHGGSSSSDSTSKSHKDRFHCHPQQQPQQQHDGHYSRSSIFRLSAYDRNKIEYEQSLPKRYSLNQLMKKLSWDFEENPPIRTTTPTMMILNNHDNNNNNNHSRTATTIKHDPSCQSKNTKPKRLVASSHKNNNNKMDPIKNQTRNRIIETPILSNEAVKMKDDTVPTSIICYNKNAIVHDEKVGTVQKQNSNVNEDTSTDSAHTINRSDTGDALVSTSKVAETESEHQKQQTTITGSHLHCTNTTTHTNSNTCINTNANWKCSNKINKYRCKLCGQYKQNHICPYQHKDLQLRSIGIMVYNCINPYSAIEKATSCLVPSLHDMNNFIVCTTNLNDERTSATAAGVADTTTTATTTPTKTTISNVTPDQRIVTKNHTNPTGTATICSSMISLPYTSSTTYHNNDMILEDIAIPNPTIGNIIRIDGQNNNNNGSSSSLSSRILVGSKRTHSHILYDKNDDGYSIATGNNNNDHVGTATLMIDHPHHQQQQQHTNNNHDDHLFMESMTLHPEQYRSVSLTTTTRHQHRPPITSSRVTKKWDTSLIATTEELTTKVNDSHGTDCYLEDNNSLAPTKMTTIASSSSSTTTTATRLGSYQYIPIPLPPWERKRMYDTLLFMIEHGIPDLKEECIGILKSISNKHHKWNIAASTTTTTTSGGTVLVHDDGVEEDDNVKDNVEVTNKPYDYYDFSTMYSSSSAEWDLAVSELLTQVIVGLNCTEGDVQLYGLSKYLMKLGIAC